MWAFCNILLLAALLVSILRVAHANESVPNDAYTNNNNDTTCSLQQQHSAGQPILIRPPHEMPRATWQDFIPINNNNKSSSHKAVGPLSTEQIETFYRDGVLVLPDFYTPTQIAAVQADVEESITKLAQELYQAKRIKSLYSDLDWTERLLQITKDDPDAPIIFSKKGILPPSFWDIYSDERILGIATQLGLDHDDAIALNPAWNLRAKMPRDDITVVPWHQDNSYWEPRLWDEMLFTVWVALVPTTKANGCMQFIRGGHRSGKTFKHVLGRSGTTWYTEMDDQELQQHLLSGDGDDDDDDNIITCEVSPGTAIIFPGTTPHRSLDSTEESIRWSTDFRLHNIKANRPGKGGDLDWFYGLKDSLVVRDGTDSSTTTSFKIDWDQWAGVDRTKVQNENVGLQSPPDFDPIIVGPWMDLWDIEKHPMGLENPHINRYIETLKDGDKHLIQSYKEANNW